jgi:transcriptional regulator GlxA family with amidase domain
MPKTLSIARSAVHQRAAAVTGIDGFEVRCTSTATVVRRAFAHIDDHLDEPLTIVDIARAARLTPRGLQAAFRRELDTTPMGYLRDARLAAAHAELQRADPSTTTVPEVAVRWGFPDPAYFARIYRRAFGTAPRRTLDL